MAGSAGPPRLVAVGDRYRLRDVQELHRGDLTHSPANTQDAKQACFDRAPVAWAPFRGVRFGTGELSAEYEVAGAVIALLFAATVVVLARRSASRRADG